MTKQLANWSPYDNNGGSCFAIAGADYCVIAADFTRDHTKISQLSEKSVIVSCGFQADVKALQVVLSAENLIYERQHNKPMSCPETLRLFCRLRKCHPKCVFVVLGGLDSEGKGWVFTHFGDGVGDPRVGDSSQDSGSRLIMPPILKYKLPAEDVLARLSETEAVGLAKRVFASATHTGDKLEIVVLNASGLRREHVDLRKDCDRRWDKLEVLVQTATGVRSEYMDLRKDCDRRHGQVFSRKRKRNNSAVAESSSV